MILSEIISLSRSKGYCYASNAFLAKATGSGERTVGCAVKELLKRNYINVEIKRNSSRIIRINTDVLNNDGIFIPQTDEIKGSANPANPRTNSADACVDFANPVADFATNNNKYNNNYKNSYNSQEQRNSSYDIEELMIIK